eukprot:GFUD01041190.1.p1 GENE.GFUD01041190.1~~GFUD01041190.1.p1  ORF type:complete len:632 (+),score=203.75 GFUD01041190.1:128-1897(+)
MEEGLLSSNVPREGLVSTPELSEEEEWDTEAPELCGTLNKWTNYIHGWQQRFMALKDGTLVYYKSASETDFGCRGAISVGKAVVTSHELDEMRFDVSVGDCVWYLRAHTVEERERWVTGLEVGKREELVGGRLKRQGSAMSLSSTTYSSHSANSTKVRHQALGEKLAECETFKDILCRQIETLQSYFDACSSIASSLAAEPSPAGGEGGLAAAGLHRPISADLLLQHGLHAVDFKGEAITFKATTAGILATLQYCIELMGQREEQLKKRLEREQIARRQAEEKCRQMEAARGEKEVKVVGRAGPDYEEGPHSQLGEDEFYDAVESALDKLEEELEMKEQLKVLVGQKDRGAHGHRLDPEIDNITVEQLKYARLPPGEGVWELFAEDGEMKMYKREEEVDGMVVDPLKALHAVNNVTARELCHYFFSPDVRTEWEHTIDSMSVLEEISPSSLIFQQVHKRVWPTAQRDAVFWSHMRQVEVTPSEAQQGVVDNWIVCNKSCDHPAAPLGQGGCLRVDLTVCFLCQTVVREGGSRGRREDLSCRITYCSVVNPGGWAPATVLRAVYKREYPRFLKRFTQYVIDKTKAREILW